MQRKDLIVDGHLKIDIEIHVVDPKQCFPVKRHGHVEAVGKPLKTVILRPSGQQRNFADGNKDIYEDDSRPD